MDIFEFAKEKEKYAEDFYRELAYKATQPGLAKIFEMLADEEEKHFEVVEKMQSQTPTEVAQTAVLSEARSVFEKMREGAGKFTFELSELELYKKAQDIEKEARQFYQAVQGKVDDPAQKKIFARLAEEENKHYLLLDNIIEFVNRPDQWLENAEFYHLEEY